MNRPNKLHPQPPDATVTDTLVEEALREDLAAAGDITTNAIVPPERQAIAHLVARQPGRLAGLFMAERVFARLDPDLVFESLAADGSDVQYGEPLARLSGDARSILTGERTALNFVGRLSGIATSTRTFQEAIGRIPPDLVSTRKTAPVLRVLEKYAVIAGGGGTHRYGLYDAVLVKDNHIALAGGIRQAVERARESLGVLTTIQVEVDSLDQLEELLLLGVDAVLLDNMDPDTLRRAVEMCAGKILTEASGGVTLENIRAVADSGVDRISVGALTHSARALDVALDIEP